MLLIHCPYCEDDRPELEFRHAGEAHIARPASEGEAGPAVAAALYLRTNARGVVFERWRHIHGCGRFFNAARHSVSDAFLAFYKVGEPRPELEGVGPDLGPNLAPNTGPNPGLDRLGAGATPATVGLEGQPSPITPEGGAIPPVPHPSVGPDLSFADTDRESAARADSGNAASRETTSDGESA